MNRDYLFYGPYDVARSKFEKGEITLKLELGKEVMKYGNLC